MTTLYSFNKLKELFWDFLSGKFSAERKFCKMWLADTNFPSEKYFEVEKFQLLTMIFSENFLSVEMGRLYTHTCQTISRILRSISWTSHNLTLWLVNMVYFRISQKHPKERWLIKSTRYSSILTAYQQHHELPLTAYQQHCLSTSPCFICYDCLWE
jgi:hypothetical protein